MVAAGLFEEISDTKKKRKKECNRKLLLVGEKVEVRDVDDKGLGGSWNSGIVTAEGNLVRDVKLDHIYLEYSCRNLIKSIPMSAMIEGDIPSFGMPKTYRGLIRPVPPLVGLSGSFLSYGVCVDVHLKDAWCEGVVFDHGDGFSEERLIFFPDKDMELRVEVGRLRITQDWDEITQHWTPRGYWLFLQLIEEHTREIPLDFSVRQLWCILRKTDAFKKRITNWTSSSTSMWDAVTAQVIRDIADNVLSVNCTCKSQGPAGKVISGRQVEEIKMFVGPCETNVNLPAGEAEDTGNSPRKTTSSTELVSEDQLEVYTPQQPTLQNERDPSDADDSGDSVPTENSFFLDDFVTKDDLCINNLLKHAFDPKEANLKDLVPADPNSRFGIADSRNNELVTRDEFCGDLPCSDSELIDYIDFNDGFEKWGEEAQPTYVLHGHDGRRDAKSWVPAGPDILPGADHCKYSTQVGDEFCGDLPCSDTELIDYIDFNYGFEKWGEEAQPTYVLHGHDGRGDAKSWVPAGPDILPGADHCKYLTQVGDASFSSCSSSSCSESQALVLHEKALPKKKKKIMKRAHVDRDLEVDIEPIYCPQALIDWYHLASGDKRRNCPVLSLKAKQHLVAVGWRLWYIVKQKTRRELRYTSPQNHTCISLVRACKEVMKDIHTGKEFKPSSREKSTSEIIYTGVEESCLPKKRQFTKLYIESATTAADLRSKNGRQLCDHNVPSQEGKKRKLSRSHIKEGDQRDDIHRNRVSQSSERDHHIVVSSPPMHHNPRTLLSCLIDSNVVLPRAKVYCMKNECKLAEGQITRIGIRCNCCQEVFNLASFEAHAGSTSHQPTASIYLDDGTGRSLLQCQKQMIQDRKLKSSSSEPYERIKRNIPSAENDFICSVCRYGGQLLLCDQCPSSFHLSCLGLKDSDLPEGKWFCPSCKCGICEQRELNGDIEKFTAKTILCCDQCEREYHVGCIRQRELVKLESCPTGNWFCSGNCEKIFEGLQQSLGKSYPVGVENLSYTILKSHRDGYHDLDASETDIMAELQSKLYVALGVMHECFDPIRAPRTKRDLIEDVLFSNWSKLNRLNFRGFYTIILHKEDEMISVATFRVYGTKVAEVPLVGTCVEYRGRGMGSILMDVIGKKLAELGVERLVLPAVAKVLHTWTTTFGFSEMTKSERLKFLQYTFLDFQDTKMCQKMLRTIPTPPTPTSADKSSESRALSAGNQHKLEEGHEANVDPDKQSVASEVIQAEEIEQCEVVEQNLNGLPS